MAASPHRVPEGFAERVRGSVFSLHRHLPFFGILIESCSIRCGPVGTACVDRNGRITVDPNFASTLPDLQLMFVLAHEVCHVAFEHFRRTADRDRHLWNAACDHAINLLLAESFSEHARAAVPEGLLLDEDHRNLSAEEIYERLRQQGQGAAPPWTDLDFDGTSSGTTVREGHSPMPDHSGDDAGEWRRRIAGAATHARLQGKLPAGLARAVEEHLCSKVDWATQLRQHLRFGIARPGREHYTFLPCNRRYIAEGLYLPSLVGSGSPRIAFAVDTSGSMGEAEIAQALGEIDEIRRQFDCPVYVIECDADVHEGRWVGVYEPLEAPKGGGGTDFRPVFEHLRGRRVPIDVVVYLTDGWGEFGDDPMIPTIWVMTTDERPPWGEFVQVSVDA